MSMIGMHYTQDPTTANEHIDWIRMWDNEVYWNRIHEGVDRYNWARLDYLVDTLYAGKKIVYCIGGTPKWLARNPNETDYKAWMGEGSNSLPSLTAGGTDPYGVSFSKGIDEWNKFCYALADRYAGKISAYEFWNEPQLLGYMAPWDASTRDDLARMLKRGAGTMKTVDPSAVMIGPSIFVGTSGRVSRATKIVEALAGTQGSFGPWANFDAMACHIYPATGADDTEWRRQLDENRSIISTNGGPNKTWITETNYNLLGPVLPEDQTTYDLVANTYAQAGGKFIFWYAWDRTADLGGLDINTETTAYSAMVETIKGIDYPPVLTVDFTPSNTEWTGAEPSDSLTVTINAANTSGASLNVAVTNRPGMSPQDTSIADASNINFTETITSNEPDNIYRATFRIYQGEIETFVNVQHPIPEKPTVVVVPSISLNTSVDAGEWTGDQPSDTITPTFTVTNTSDSNSLTVTHTQPGLAPSSASISVGSSQAFAETLTARPANGIYEVTFTGTANDTRQVQSYASANIGPKPLPPPPPPEEEIHSLDCYWYNHKNRATRTREDIVVNGPAAYGEEICTDDFVAAYPDAWLGGDDWYLTSYVWDDTTTTPINPPAGSSQQWPVTSTLSEVYLTSGATINENHYRKLIIMEDGGTLNMPEEMGIGFQCAVLCYTNPVTLSSGKVDKTNETIPVNMLTVVSKVI